MSLRDGKNELHLNFMIDTHDIIEKDASLLLDEYEKLGRKMNIFIQYVEKEWK